MTPKPLNLALCSPTTTSAGGDVFAASIGAEMAKLKGVNLVASNQLVAEQLDIPALASLSSIVEYHSLHLSAVQRSGFASTTLWPLSVGAVEAGRNSVFGDSLKAQLRSAAIRRQLAISIRRADSLIFSSNYALSRFSHYFRRVGRIPQSVIPTGAGLLDAPARSRRSTEERLEQPIVLWVSQAYPYKNLSEAVAGFLEFRSRIAPNAELRIAGRLFDEATRDLVLEVASNNTSGVEYCGVLTQAELVEEYANADMFLFTSRSENGGSFALADAFLFGLPTVCSDRSSLREFCAGAALLIDPDQPTEIADALELLASDRQSYEQFEEASVARGGLLPSWGDVAAAAVDHVEKYRGLG